MVEWHMYPTGWGYAEIFKNERLAVIFDSDGWRTSVSGKEIGVFPTLELAQRAAETEARRVLTEALEGLGHKPYQARVQDWMQTCFGGDYAHKADAMSLNTRMFRFFEEAVELFQACDATKAEALKLVDYVYERPIGDPAQEVGGVMVTLAALCGSLGIDMEVRAEAELARINASEMIAKIRAKQATKPKHSPLPTPVERLGNGWQPIETAPKKRIILLFAFTNDPPGNWKMASGSSNPDGTWMWDGQPVRTWDHQPTHWRPLPAPPET